MGGACFGFDVNMEAQKKKTVNFKAARVKVSAFSEGPVKKELIVNDERIQITALIYQEGVGAMRFTEKTGRDAYLHRNYFFTKEQAEKLSSFFHPQEGAEAHES